MTPTAPHFADVDDARIRLEAAGYFADRPTAVVAFLASALEKPLLLEGPAGVGKTELAKAIASATGRELVRLQCYEGLDEAKALYEWEYGKQMLYTQLLRDAVAARVAGAPSLHDAVARLGAEAGAFFDERFLVERPLLRAIRSTTPTVLLIDEVDRSDPEFEALLLEVLSDFQVTVPELGTFHARTRPIVVLTSNGTRELTEALRRRCLYRALDYPAASLELAILARRLPDAPPRLVEGVVRVVQALRTLDLKKAPSVSETIDWARALVLLHAEALTPELARATLDVIAKHREDLERIEPKVESLVRGD